MWDYRSLAWRLPSGRVGRNGIVLRRRRRHPTPDELSVFLGISARRKQRLNTLRPALGALTCGLELATPLPIAIPPLVLPHPMAPGSLIPRVRCSRLNFEQINCLGSTMAGSNADNGGGKLVERKALKVRFSTVGQGQLLAHGRPPSAARLITPHMRQLPNEMVLCPAAADELHHYIAL